MSVTYNQNNIPYDGDMNKAMKAQDREAIRFLLSQRSEKKEGKSTDDSDEEQCMICLDEFNYGRRRKIICPGECGEGCCEECFRRSLLESSSSTPSCPKCSHKLSLEFVANVTPKCFHNGTFRRKRSLDLLSKERSLLPATQHLIVDAEERIRREKLIYELSDEARYLRFRLKEIDHEINLLGRRVHRKDEKKERKRFIMGCPVPDCRGFLSQAWKCGTCGKFTCSKCRIIKEGKNEDHKCNDDDVATAKLLAKETKPCPQCAIPIFKISGCDQMWCTECQTPFSWKTGQKVSGVIHNPHFYQWQRQQNSGNAPRRPGTRYDCGGLPWVRTIRHILKTRKIMFKNWEECHRSVHHFRAVVMPRYPPQVGVEDHTDLRLKFLLKDIDEKIWLTKLRRRQKKIEKNQEVHNILDMFVVTLTDLFQRFTTHDVNLPKEAYAIRDYVNTNLQRVSIRYNNVVPQITDEWGCKSWA